MLCVRNQSHGGLAGVGCADLGARAHRRGFHQGGAMMQVSSLIAEIEAAMRASLYLSSALLETCEALHDQLNDYPEVESPSLDLLPPDVLALHDKWACLADGLMWCDGRLRCVAGNLLKQLDSCQRTGLRGLGGVRMWLHNVKCSTELESNAWQELCAACDEAADLKALCEAIAMRRTAVGEADARMVDALHRLLLALLPGAATSQAASVR